MSPPEALFALLFGCGVWAVSAAGLALAFSWASRPARLLGAAAGRLRARRAAVPLPEEERRMLRALGLGAAAGAAFGLLLAGRFVPNLVFFCAALGAGAAWFLQRGLGETERMRRMREVAVLYEAVDFYTRAGYTVRQALSLATAVVSAIRPAVERCLAAWPQGPVRALERMAEEVNLPEASVLATVLMHVEEAGVERGRAAVEEEARGLEALRRSLAELKVVSRPLYYCVYRALPLAAVGGVLVGPLVYRLVRLLSQSFGAFSG